MSVKEIGLNSTRKVLEPHGVDAGEQRVTEHVGAPGQLLATFS